ncbi:MAG TPA: glycosyltransferase family 2 protein [Candidatus Rifleibacterium sp.]|nr:glycosyltransferase family 2 protein [Candidatus Rifleibacterium sp.]
MIGNLRSDSYKRVTVIIPCRNEKKFIKPLLESVNKMDYPSNKLEVIVVDGMSDDGTREIVADYAKRYSNIKILDNPAKVVPHALNAAIAVASGDVIIRMDVHALYPSDYISVLVDALAKTGGDNVGACCETLPASDSLIATAIALAGSHPFGVGNSTFRLLNESSEPVLVDTVPFGCFPKEVFKRFGLFDEELIRNQDNEFNERILKNGGKIFLIPSLKIKYFARENYTKLWKMFYQYGYFGPLVDLKLGKRTRPRRYIPSIFVLSLILPFLLGFFRPSLRKLSCVAFLLHAFVNSIVSSLISIRQRNLRLIPYLLCAFLVSHLSYGVGYLRGYFDFVLIGSRRNVELSR